MRSRKPFIIFWPQYFEAKRSRSNGRRLPKKFASEKVSLEDISMAAKNLGYNAQIERGYKYSRTWWDDTGRVLIDTKGKKKSKVMLEVAKEIRKLHTKV
ncbi:MAG: signal recognition particle protein Srp19 [Candidatus Lokiarchaeota archaeon]|nr:signal recognition particle protein Srp19 [Candidatus Lokiarchaeota archaeon]